MVEVVAEISGNHGGVLQRALELIYEAAEAGCDYAKFQYYRPEDMPDRHKGDNEAMYRKLMVHDDWLPLMFQCARANSIGLFASVFSVRAVEELLKYDVPYIKIASPDSTELSYAEYKGIGEAVPRHVGLIVSSDSRHAEQMWNYYFWDKAPLRMYCPPGHPQVLLGEDYDFGWHHSINGFSDHSTGISAPLSMIREFPATLKMIEKHLKLDGGIDDVFSADPLTMKTLCRLAHNRK